jgi:hypothetical protein
VAEITVDERRREAEIVGRKAEEAERKAAHLRARQFELLGEVPDVEMSKLFHYMLSALSKGILRVQ